MIFKKTTKPNNQNKHKDQPQTLKILATAKPFTNINIGFIVIYMLTYYNKALFILHDEAQLPGTLYIVNIKYDLTIIPL